jgi:ribonuclease HI
MGIGALIQLHRKNILVQSDSQLMVRQLNGDASYRILHVRRKMNKLADRLAKRGIDDAS